MLNDLIQLAGTTVAENLTRPVVGGMADGARIDGAAAHWLDGLSPRFLRDLGFERKSV